MDRYSLPRRQREGPMDQTLELRHKDRKTKTILVVDDDAAVLAVVANMLVDREYTILTAVSGAKGLEQSREFKGEIHLLLADFQMPGMSGVELATAMTVERPGLKVLLMSGFTNGLLVLNEGWHFLNKPFIASQLQALVVGLVFPERNSKFSKRAPGNHE
jgi:two-component system cell cycle sensor histidine kinase/response regulator CckA